MMKIGLYNFSLLVLAVAFLHNGGDSFFTLNYSCFHMLEVLTLESLSALAQDYISFSGLSNSNLPIQ